MQVWQTIQYVMTFVGCQSMHLLCNEIDYLVFCEVIAPIFVLRQMPLAVVLLLHPGIYMQVHGVNLNLTNM